MKFVYSMTEGAVGECRTDGIPPNGVHCALGLGI